MTDVDKDLEVPKQAESHDGEGHGHRLLGESISFSFKELLKK